MAFYVFFPNLFTPGESFGVLPDDNMQYDEGFPSSPTPYKLTPFPFWCGDLSQWLYTRYFFLPSESHHCNITPRAEKAIKGQGSLHHSAGLVCKDKVNVKGLCNEPDGSEAEHVL